MTESTRHVPANRGVGRPKDSEHRRADEWPHEREQRWIDAFNSLDDLMMIINVDYTVERINDHGVQLLGTTRADVIGAKCYQVVHGLEAPCAVCPVPRMLRTGRVEAVDWYEKTVDRYFSVKSSPIFNDRGEIVRFVDLMRDITAQKQVEAALRASEDTWRALLENIPDFLITVDQDHDILMVNRGVPGITVEQIVGTSVYTYVEPAHHDVMRRALDAVFHTGRPERYEVLGTGPKGPNTAWYETRVFPNQHGDHVGSVTLISTDITERKRREDEMKKRLMRFQLEDGTLYLVKERVPVLSLEAFKDLLKAGYHGFVVSRTPEAEVRKGVEGFFTFRWLAERGGENAIAPDIEALQRLVESLPRKAVLLFERLDYVFVKNGFQDSVSFVQYLRETALLRGSIVILSLDPSALSDRAVRLVEKEAREVEPRVVVRLSEDLLELVRLVYEHNAVGVKPNHASIGRALSISKPTVSKRINRLITTGYVTENVKGSSKVLELTQKGMRLFVT